MLAQQSIDRVRRFRGNAFPVLSVYVNVGTDVRSIGSRLRDMLKPIRASISSLDHRAAESLRADVAAMKSLEKTFAADAGHGVAVFSCSALDFREYLKLPRAVWDVAIADAKPYVRPLDAVLDEFHRYCAVVLDRRRAVIFEFYMGELESWHETIQEGRRVSNFGGWYGLAEYGVRRHAEEVRHRHYRETAALVAELFEERSFDILLLGGHKDSVEEIVPFLPAWLAQLVAGTFVVDPHTVTASIVRERCAELEEAYERSLERHAVQMLFDRAGGTELGVVGIGDTLAAANARAIDMLLIDGESPMPGVECEACGWLGRALDTCPVCMLPTRKCADVVGHLARHVVDAGGSVENVFAETPLRGWSVGALLRFPLPDRARVARKHKA